jgi:threonine/homoserine/homoserine lactone efflux protein
MLMTNHVSLMAGILVGFAIAAPIGPMGMLCIQRTLAAGMAVGISTGLGAATVNIGFGAAILLGLDTLSPWMASGQRLFSALGGLFLLWSALRTMRRRRITQEPPPNATLSPLAAYGSAVLFNATNPMAVILILALLSPMVGHSRPSLDAAAALLLGMLTAATTWWVCLCGSVAMLRARLSPTVLRYVNNAAGLLLTFYGALALARSVQM